MVQSKWVFFLRKMFYTFLVLVIFSILWLSKYSMDTTDESSYILFLACVVGSGMLYMIYFIISEGLLGEIIFGIIISVAITAVSALFPPLAILAVLYLFYSIIRSVKSLISLLPIFLMSLILFGTLFYEEINSLLFSRVLNDNINVNEILSIRSLQSFSSWYFSLTYARYTIAIFFIASILIACKISSDNLRSTLLQVSLIFISIPLVIIIIASLKSAYDNLFKTKYNFSSESVDKPVNVKGYTRTDGIQVNGYVRHTTQTVNHITTTQVIGTGAAIAGSAKTIVNAIDKINDESISAGSQNCIEEET